MQQRANTSDPYRSVEKRRIALALQGGGSHGAFIWGAVGGAELGNRGHQRHQRRRHECGGSRRWPAPRRSLAGAASFTGLLAGCRPPAGILEVLATGSAAHVAHRPQPPLPLGDMLTRVWSAYQINCSDYHLLPGLLQHIDFEGLRDDASAPRVFI
jgi:hypothetical protein